MLFLPTRIGSVQSSAWRAFPHIFLKKPRQMRCFGAEEYLVEKLMLHS